MVNPYGRDGFNIQKEYLSQVPSFGHKLKFETGRVTCTTRESLRSVSI
jgi:hypothetical protein